MKVGDALKVLSINKPGDGSQCTFTQVLKPSYDNSRRQNKPVIFLIYIIIAMVEILYWTAKLQFLYCTSFYCVHVSTWKVNIW